MELEQSGEGAFAGSRGLFEAMAAWLEGGEASGLEHAELEGRIEVEGREVLRQLFQDHLDLRAQNEARLNGVLDAQGTPRGTVEAGHERALSTMFGQVQVRRFAYRRRGHPNLHPADGWLNLPAERHSHGLRRLAAVKDRMDLTGARWGLQGAEAVLKLRAVHSNGDFPDYWRYHLSQERRRNHQQRYANNAIP